jgi:hypothetical protein
VTANCLHTPSIVTEYLLNYNQSSFKAAFQCYTWSVLGSPHPNKSPVYLLAPDCNLYSSLGLPSLSAVPGVVPVDQRIDNPRNFLNFLRSPRSRFLRGCLISLPDLDFWFPLIAIMAFGQSPGNEFFKSWALWQKMTFVSPYRS